jgi:hypothetical protein
MAHSGQATGKSAGRVKAPLLKNINDSGTISGLYVDNNNVTHGFIRLPDYNDR